MNSKLNKFDESIANIDRLLLKDLSKEQLIEKVIEIENKNMKLTIENQQLKEVNSFPKRELYKINRERLDANLKLTQENEKLKLRIDTNTSILAIMNSKLEEENKELKEQVECLIKQRDDISANAVETIEKYQQENKYLKLTNPEQNIEHFRMLKENKIKIDNLRRQNKELKAKLKMKEILCFNMPKDIDIICLTKADYERNKSDYETIGKYKNIASKAMNFINCNATDFDDGRWILELNELKLLELESILRGEK